VTPIRYRAAGDHPVDLASGATVVPGEVAVGVDPKAAHDKHLIDEGRLVEIQSKSASKAKTSENKEASQ
jgi:hypothetical protein